MEQGVRRSEVLAQIVGGSGDGIGWGTPDDLHATDVDWVKDYHANSHRAVYLPHSELGSVLPRIGASVGDDREKTLLVHHRYAEACGWMVVSHASVRAGILNNWNLRASDLVLLALEERSAVVVARERCDNQGRLFEDWMVEVVGWGIVFGHLSL